MREQTHSKNIITGATGANPSEKKSLEPSEQIHSKKWERWESRSRAEMREKMESRDERERRAQTKWERWETKERE